MALHRHKNQAVLDRIGNVDALPPYSLDSDSESADLRTWSVLDGLRDGVGNPLDPGGTAGVAFAPVRVTAGGAIYARRIAIDSTGMLAAVGAEQAVFKAGSAVFQATGDGFTPRASAPAGAVDDFFERTPNGLRARTDFAPDAETEFMRATADTLDVEVKPDQ